MSQPSEPKKNRHILHLHVTSDDENAAGSACADIDALLVDSQEAQAWEGAEVWWEWLGPEYDDGMRP